MIRLTHFFLEKVTWNLWQVTDRCLNTQFMMWSMWFQELFKTSLSSPMPDFIRKVVMNNSSSPAHYQRQITTHFLWWDDDHIRVCVCVFSVYWNQTLQSWECGVHLSPTWTSPRWVRECGHRPTGSSTVEVKAHSSLKRYNATVWWDIFTYSYLFASPNYYKLDGSGEAFWKEIATEQKFLG